MVRRFLAVQAPKTAAKEAASKAAQEAAARAAQSNVASLPDLTYTRAQLEAKFKHAPAFGVMEPRGTAGFDAFGKALDDFVRDPATTRVMGTYRKAPAILNYNVTTRLVLVQTPAGEFVSGWQMLPNQFMNVVTRRSLGGG